MIGYSLMAQCLKLHAPNAGGPGSIPGQETRSDICCNKADPMCHN